MCRCDYACSCCCCCGPEFDEPTTRYGKQFKRLGITQIVLGSAAVAIQSALFVHVPLLMDYSGGLAWSCSGCWSGFMMLMAGTLGSASAIYPSHNIIIGTLVMTISAAITSSAMVVLEIWAAAISEYPYQCKYYIDPPLPRECHKSSMDTQIALHIALSVVGFTAAITSIVHSSYCCAVNCRRDPAPPSRYIVSRIEAIPGLGQVPFYSNHQLPTVADPVQGSNVIIEEPSIPVQNSSNLPPSQTALQQLSQEATQHPIITQRNNNLPPSRRKNHRAASNQQNMYYGYSNSSLGHVSQHRTFNDETSEQPVTYHGGSLSRPTSQFSPANY